MTPGPAQNDRCRGAGRAPPAPVDRERARWPVYRPPTGFALRRARAPRPYNNCIENCGGDPSAMISASPRLRVQKMLLRCGGWNVVFE